MGVFNKLKGIKDVVDSVGDAADKNFTTREERMAKNNEDKANARESNVKIQESENASWLSKNIAPILAINVVLLIWFIVYALVYIDIPEGNEPILHQLSGLIVGILITIATFHWGGSESANLKDKARKIFRRK